jgi:hypothetical protein
MYSCLHVIHLLSSDVLEGGQQQDMWSLAQVQKRLEEAKQRRQLGSAAGGEEAEEDDTGGESLRVDLYPHLRRRSAQEGEAADEDDDTLSTWSSVSDGEDHGREAGVEEEFVDDQRQRDQGDAGHSNNDPTASAPSAIARFHYHSALLTSHSSPPPPPPASLPLTRKVPLHLPEKNSLGVGRRGELCRNRGSR